MQELSALATVVGAVTAAPSRQTPTESELLSLFAAHEELEEEPARWWLAGALGPLNALVPEGASFILSLTCHVGDSYLTPHNQDFKQRDKTRAGAFNPIAQAE